MIIWGKIMKNKIITLVSGKILFDVDIRESAAFHGFFKVTENSMGDSYLINKNQVKRITSSEIKTVKESD